jgi:hypothetical protein
MTETYEECPNDCSSAGEVWNGEELVLCPICKGNTTVVKKIINWEEKARFLWDLLDNIDTLDDACKDNNEGFRKLVYIQQRRRYEISTCDGYTVLFNGEKT